MENIDFQRIFLLIKRDLLSDKSRYIKFMIGGYLAFVAIMIINLFDDSRTITYINDPNIDISYALASTAGVVLLVYLFMVVVMASRTFSNFLTKGNRISYLTLPATNQEKYLSRLLQTIVIFPAALFVLVLLADLSQVVFFSIVSKSIGFIIPFVFGKLHWIYTDSESLLLTFIVVLFYISTVFTYVLGSAFFRKQPFIMTSLALWAISTVLSIVGSILFQILGTFINWDTMEHFFQNLAQYFDAFIPIAKVAGVVIPTLWSIFCIWLSYRLFRKASVIPKGRFGF